MAGRISCPSIFCEELMSIEAESASLSDSMIKPLFVLADFISPNQAADMLTTVTTKASATIKDEIISVRLVLLIFTRILSYLTDCLLLFGALAYLGNLKRRAKLEYRLVVCRIRIVHLFFSVEGCSIVDILHCLVGGV